MAETTKIAWCEATINPWWGCSKCAAGCANCYAQILAHRYHKIDLWKPNGPRLYKPNALETAEKLNRKAACAIRALREKARK